MLHFIALTVESTCWLYLAEMLGDGFYERMTSRNISWKLVTGTSKPETSLWRYTATDIIWREKTYTNHGGSYHVVCNIDVFFNTSSVLPWQMFPIKTTLCEGHDTINYEIDCLKVLKERRRRSVHSILFQSYIIKLYFLRLHLSSYLAEGCIR